MSGAYGGRPLNWASILINRFEALLAQIAVKRVAKPWRALRSLQRRNRFHSAHRSVPCSLPDPVRQDERGTRLDASQEA